jgi:hypothetical protein
MASKLRRTTGIAAALSVTMVFTKAQDRGTVTVPVKSSYRPHQGGAAGGCSEI